MKCVHCLLMSIFILFVFGCESKWKRDLMRVDPTSLHGNDYNNWRLLQKIEFHYDLEYTIKKVDEDTAKVLFYRMGVDGDMFVSGYKEQYPCGLGDTCFVEWDSSDTVFFYKQKDNVKTFVVGEYFYKMAHINLDIPQFNYFEVHEDSLRKVRGNNLPTLPRLE